MNDLWAVNNQGDSGAHQVQAPPGTDLFAFAGDVTYESAQQAVEQMYTREDKSSSLLLAINTFGGDPHQAFRLARAATINYDRMTVYVPRFCKSSGMLVCLAADEIVMSNYGELGPLNVQHLKNHEVNVHSLDLDLTSAFRQLQNQTLEAFRNYYTHAHATSGISAETAAHTAARLAGGTMQPVFRQIDPYQIGESARMMEVAIQYGLLLASSNVKDKAITELVREYPSPEFVIDYKEARNLFKNVRRVGESEKDTFRAIDALSHIDQLPEGEATLGYLSTAARRSTRDQARKLLSRKEIHEMMAEGQWRYRRKMDKLLGRSRSKYDRYCRGA